MNEKFELSLWREYHPSEDINIHNKNNPGKGIRILKTLEELTVGNCYYVWDDAESGKSEDFYWRYPCSYTHRKLRSGRNGNNMDDYTYYFIDEKGRTIATLGYGPNNYEIGVPVFHIREEKLNVLANNNMEQYQGKIYNIHFISKIDGTHTLTFQVPQYYLDIYDNKRKKNEYLDWLYTKAKLKLFYKNEWYDFVINKREERKTKGYIEYSFEANDLAVEELSKTGFTLNLTEDEEVIELCGFGNIEELTNRIAAGTTWKYDAELTTANQQEFKTGNRFNPITNQYEDTYEPTMIYKNHYSPCLKKYVYQTEYYYNLNDIDYNNSFDAVKKYSIKSTRISKNKNHLPIYYTTETQTDCAGSTNNLITSNSNFTSISEWKTTKGIIRPYKTDDMHCLSVNSNSIFYTTNFTTNHLESKPYVFKIITNIPSENLKYTIKLLSGNTVVYKGECQTNKNYCIYPNKHITSPELQLEFNAAAVIKEIQLFEIALRDTNSQTLAITGANLGVSNKVTADCCFAFNYTTDEIYTNRGIISLHYILLPNAIIQATARAEKKFFIEPYLTLQQIQYAANDNTIDALTNEYIIPIEEDYLVNKLKNERGWTNKQPIQTYTYNEIKNFSADSITLPAIENQNSYVIYQDQFKQTYYYNVIAIKYKNQTYYLWKNSLLQYSDKKRRLITGSRSNRWNFFQEIAEKFQVYPKFLVLHNPETGEYIYKNGAPIKKIYFVDRFGEQNYAGFKEGINVSETKRKIVSDEVVTKMYVDNIDADYNPDGYVSIQLSSKNDTLENYIYNFRHYLNTGILGDDFIARLNKHKLDLKSINDKYLVEVEIRDRLADTVNELESYKIGLETSFEESKATVELEKEKFSENVSFFRTKGNAWPSSLVKEKYSPLLTSNLQNVSAQDTASYNGFYCINDTYKYNNKSYAFFIETATIFEDWSDEDNVYRVLDTKINNTSKLYGAAAAGTFKNAYNTFKKQFKVSKRVPIGSNSDTYILKSQYEEFYQNQSIPYNSEETYYTKVTINGKTKYREVTNVTQNTNIKNYYLRYLTSENSEWFYWEQGRVFVRCSVDSQGRRRISWLFPERYIENKSTSFIKYLTTVNNFTKGDKKYLTWYESSISNVIIPTKQEKLNGAREAIAELIEGGNGQKDLLQDLHQARIEYYDALEKYKTQVLYVDRLSAEKKSLIENFEKQYNQYIKEGYWGGSGNNYADNDIYYLDALIASNNSSIPKVEYTITVIDLSPISYYKDYQFKIGDETFIKDKDMFGVNGDGVPNLERTVITQLDEQLDKNSNNKFTVKNYTNRFEELFQRIDASITTVETKDTTWSKADILNSDGSISSSLLTTLHGENSSWVNNSIGLLNGFEQNETGITLTSLVDGNYKMKLTSFGIFLTESALQNDIWTTAISSKGINADVIKTGHLLTNKITIMSEDQPAQTWNSLGISMYSIEGTQDYSHIDEHTFVRLDQYGLYFIENSDKFGYAGALPWFKSKLHNDALQQIKTDAKVSLTRLGFRYNSNPGNTNNYIEIGKLTNSNLEGIQLVKNGETWFRVDNGGGAQIASFNFDNSHMWSSIGRDKNPKTKKPYGMTSGHGINNVYDYGGFFLGKIDADKGTAGLSMKNIKLETSGLATFGNINLTGGQINGQVTIAQAMIGPFRVIGQKTDSTGKPTSMPTTLDKLEGLYAKYNPSSKSFTYGISSESLVPLYSSNNKNGNDTVDARVALINRTNKFYLGEFKLSREIFAKNQFNKSIYDKAFPSGKNKTADGILLSIGDVFWVHSAGYGFANGNFYFNGTLYANKIDANSISVAGQDVMSVIKQNTGLQVSGSYTTIPSGSATKGFKTTNGTNGLAMNTTLNITAYEDGSTKKTFKNVPALEFSRDGYASTYIVPEYHNDNGIKWIDMYVVSKVGNAGWVCHSLFA